MTSTKRPPLGSPALDPEHRPRRRIEEEEPAPVVQRHDPFGHPVEDRADLGLLVAETLDLLAKREGRPVERDPERGDLVRSGDGHRLREVALGHPAGRALHPPEGPRHPPAHEEPDHHGHADGEDGAAGNGTADERPGLVDVARRNREPEDRASPTVALDRHRDVQEVAPDGRAPADVAADLARQRPAHLRPAGMILDLADGLAIGFGQDGAVGADDGQTRPENPRIALGTSLEVRPTGRAVERGTNAS